MDLREVAGALSSFWSGGNGPSHSSIGTALALAGYDEPAGDIDLNKQQRVLFAVRKSDPQTAMRVVAELVDALDVALHAASRSDPNFDRLSLALERVGGSLTEGGQVDWNQSTETGDERPAAQVPMSTRPASSAGSQSHDSPHAPETDRRKVMVVYGRDEPARSAVFGRLRAMGLAPIEWEQAVAATGQASPYTKDTVEAAFRIAQAVVVLLTPDDQVQLHSDLAAPRVRSPETQPAMQARPNVFIELGMSLALHPDRTLIVEIGTIRKASDLDGVNVIRLAPDVTSLHKLATRLSNCGCDVDRSGTDWLDVTAWKRCRPSIESLQHLRHLTRQSASLETKTERCLRLFSGINQLTYPHQSQRGWYGVPAEWEMEARERFVEAVATLEGLADDLVGAHQALVLEGRRRSSPRQTHA
jgi:predicted nucleotide-binding protein